MSIPGFDPTVEGAISRFEPSFVERAGKEITYLKALSDLWTIAMLRLEQANNMTAADAEPILYSPPGAVEVVSAVCKADDALKMAVFQEPFGFWTAGAIEANFERVYGSGVYAAWRAAMERGEFDQCLKLTESAGPE